MKISWKRNPIVALGLSLALYLVLAYAYALVKAIWCDEVWAMIPSANLAFNGYIGMGDQATIPPFADSSAHFVYWFPPLSFVSMGAWFKVFGYNLLMARWHTIAWGVVLLAGVYYIASDYRMIIRAWGYKLHPSMKWIGVCAVLFCILDYNFLNCLTARQDIMCAALGIWAIGTRNAWFAAASCMVHPYGMLYAVLLMVLKRRIDWKPYAVALGLWGIYILQAPDIFWQQAVGQLVHHSVMSEGGGVYLAFGTGWRLVLLTIYLMCASSVAFRDARLALCMAFIVLPAFFVPHSSVYMAHAIPWLAICMAIKMRKYPILAMVWGLQLIFVVRSLQSIWGWDGVSNL